MSERYKKQAGEREREREGERQKHEKSSGSNDNGRKAYSVENNLQHHGPTEAHKVQNIGLRRGCGVEKLCEILNDKF